MLGLASGLLHLQPPTEGTVDTAAHDSGRQLLVVLLEAPPTPPTDGAALVQVTSGFRSADETAAAAGISGNGSRSPLRAFVCERERPFLTPIDVAALDSERDSRGVPSVPALIHVSRLFQRINLQLGVDIITGTHQSVVSIVYYSDPYEDFH